MKKPINVADYAGRIAAALPGGILLNTRGERFNAMVIGWGALGTVWGRSAFTVYVRRNRYTRELLEAGGEFTVSVPLEAPNPRINRVCGLRSGRDIDKAAEAGLTLEPPEVVGVPGVKEYPITLECRMLYRQEQELDRLPDDIRQRMYPQDVDSDQPLANRDPHTAYIGEIVSAYIIE